VTEVLEQLAGELLVAEVVRQDTIAAAADNPLALPVGKPITRRIALLKGAPSQRPYLYAESIFVPERLPPRVRTRLEQTGDPIGRVLVAHGFDLTRQALLPPAPPDPPPAVDWRGLAAEVIWARSYVLRLNGLPVFAIDEWFFRSVLEASDRSGARES
jgi:chorismate-pyruvate lyase